MVKSIIAIDYIYRFAHMKRHYTQHEFYVSAKVNDAVDICINTPKTRASKILLFQHYQTDAPI
jgi:hypothetical protein